MVSRHGASRDTRSGPLKTTLLDGRPSLGAFYHYRGGAWDSGDDYGIAFTQPELPHTQDNAVGFRCVR